MLVRRGVLHGKGSKLEGKGSGTLHCSLSNITTRAESAACPYGLPCRTSQSSAGPPAGICR